MLFADQPLGGLACGLGTGGPVLALAYWKHALPAHMHASVRRRLDSLLSRVVGARL